MHLLLQRTHNVENVIKQHTIYQSEVHYVVPFQKQVPNI